MRAVAHQTGGDVSAGPRECVKVDLEQDPQGLNGGVLETEGGPLLGPGVSCLIEK